VFLGLAECSESAYSEGKYGNGNSRTNAAVNILTVTF
jgi:hypothetical protein